MPAVERAGGQVHVGVPDGIHGFVNADLPSGQSFRIELYSDRKFLRAEHLHLGHPAHHGNPLRHARIRVVRNLGKRQRGRTDGHVEDRLVRWVHLAERRRRRHPLRQLRFGL